MPIDHREPYPETSIDSITDIYRPSESGHYETGRHMRAKKDVTLSNITDFDLALLSLWNNVADAAQDMGMPNVALMHAYQQTYWINLKRAVGGFERKEQGKQKQEVSGTVDYKGKAPQQIIMSPP
jgi:hypothetical protein